MCLPPGCGRGRLHRACGTHSRARRAWVALGSWWFGIKVVYANKLWTLTIAGCKVEVEGRGWVFKTQKYMGK